MPTALIARTRSSWLPARSPVTSCGVEHELNGRLSSEHSNSASGSLDSKVNSASTCTDVAGGPVRIVVSGGTTVHAWTAGVASTLPSALTARTCSS